jgi:uroporphyrinogen III methyltransferase/synthase
VTAADPALPFGGPSAAPGTVALVGAGPGDPGLVTVRAARLVATASFVAYDRLAPPELLGLCRDDSETVYVGKQPDRHALDQAELNELLVAKAGGGHAVVRLKGGDPFVLGRGSEEADRCVAAGVGFEVVPGITSAVAAPAYAGIPVTHRGLAPAFAVATGHEDPEKPDSQVDYAALAAYPGTLVLLMAVGRVGEIAEALIAAGKPAGTPIALVRWGTTPRQQTLTATLAEVGTRVAETGFAAPAVAVVGDVVGWRDRLSWFESRPLHGVSVLVPRTRQQASELSERLRALGAEPVEAPTIAIEPTTEPEALRDALGRVRDGAYDWLVLTSANGVAAVWDGLRTLGGDARWLARVAIAAVGPGTAEALAARGLSSDLVPARYTTRGLADALVALDSGPGSALLPRADIATPTLSQALAEAGWEVSEVEAYRTVPTERLAPEVIERLDGGGIDVLAFASSSTVTNFVELAGGAPQPAPRVASIGPVTSQTCRELGLGVDPEAEPHDLDGLVAAVLAAASTA